METRITLFATAAFAAVSLMVADASAQMVAEGTITTVVPNLDDSGYIESTVEWTDQFRFFNFCDSHPEDYFFTVHCENHYFNMVGRGASPNTGTGYHAQSGGAPPSGTFFADFTFGSSSTLFEVAAGDGDFTCLSPPSVGLCGCSYLLPDGRCGAAVTPPWFLTYVGKATNLNWRLPDIIYGDNSAEYYVRYTIDGDNAECGPVWDPVNQVNQTHCIGSIVLNAFLVGNTAAGGTPGSPTDNSVIDLNTSFYDPVNQVEIPMSVQVAYDAVTEAGDTTVTTSSTAAGDIPPNFEVVVDDYTSVFFDVSFENGTYEGPVRVCGSYPDDNNDGIVDGTFNTSECDLRILHNAGSGFDDEATMGLEELHPERCPYSPLDLTVFVTEGRYPPDIGVAGADTRCQTEANAAGLGGTYRAWLSTRYLNTYNPKSDWGLAGTPYRFVLPGGEVIASSWEDLVSGNLGRPVNQTVDGIAITPTDTNLSVFVTETVHPSTTGVIGADTICQSEANAAGLQGTFRAWLSTDDYSPASDWDNLASVGVDSFSFVRPDGAVVAGSWEELTSGVEGDPTVENLTNAIRLTADGTDVDFLGERRVWTGTKADGTSMFDPGAPGHWNCDNWTDEATNPTGPYTRIGVATDRNFAWTAGGIYPCSIEARVYCFEQAEGRQLGQTTVWTGTTTAGSGVFAATCNDWTSAGNSYQYQGQIGSAVNSDAGWTQLETVGCDSGEYRFYCFEEGDPDALNGPYPEPDDWCPNYVWDYDRSEYVLVGATCINRETNEICGLVDALSPFVVAVDGGLITALDVAPVPAAVNEPVEATASVCDPDFGQLLVAEIDWGDGQLDTVDAESVECGQSVKATHMYADPGVYTVTVMVTDELGEFDTETFEYAVIYDPSGGFVTGGGWFDSPEGAYAPDPALVGKANFGFVSKYKKGANVPTGNTEFQFKVADLNFKSTSYDWLVIAGDNAKYKGIGTINGEGSYEFMLWGGDGTPDTFRIRIWTENEETAAETDIYDNGFGQELGGGSVVIHKAK